MNDTEEYKGYTITIHRDECPENPWKYWDCEPPIAVMHGRDRYTTGYGVDTAALPDIPNSVIEADMVRWCEIAGVDLSDIFHLCVDNDTTAALEIRCFLEERRDELLGEQLLQFLEEVYHELGVVAVCESISGYSRGDWGYVLAVATPEWIKLVGAPDDKAALEAQLRAAIQLYEWWCYGDVYWYSVEDASGGVVDSCGGFYGPYHEKSGLLEAARESIDYRVEQERKEHLARVKVWVRNRVPLDKRLLAASGVLL